jgi:hypothetical protein
MRRHVTAANIASSAVLLSLALRTRAAGQQERRHAKNEQQSEQGDDILHVVFLRKKLIRQRAGLP